MKIQFRAIALVALLGTTLTPISAQAGYFSWLRMPNMAMPSKKVMGISLLAVAAVAAIGALCSYMRSHDKQPSHRSESWKPATRYRACLEAVTHGNVHEVYGYVQEGIIPSRDTLTPEGKLLIGRLIFIKHAVEPGARGFFSNAAVQDVKNSLGLQNVSREYFDQNELMKLKILLGM